MRFSIVFLLASLVSGCVTAHRTPNGNVDWNTGQLRPNGFSTVMAADAMHMNAETRRASAQAAFEACQSMVRRGTPGECVLTASGDVVLSIGGMYEIPFYGGYASGAYMPQPWHEDALATQAYQMSQVAETQRLQREIEEAAEDAAEE